MGKLFLFICLTVVTIFTANSQEISNSTIGVRIGNNDGIEPEISFQSLIGYTNRLEIGLALFKRTEGDYLKATTTFQWVWELRNRLNWYAGFGGGIGNLRGISTSKTFAFTTGKIGIEYNFKAPILLSLDYNPEYGFHKVYEGFNTSTGLSLRYQF